MRYIYSAAMICATASLGFGIAEDAKKDIPTDTAAALAHEWKEPATTLNCLFALRLYTTYASSPADAAAAKAALLGGVPANGDLDDLYTVAQKRPDFLKMLEEANTLKTPVAKEDTLFNDVEKLLEKTYESAGGKQKLAAVQESISRKNSSVALFQLLDAYPKPSPIDQAYANDLETFRACYKLKPDRLFKLVSDKISPAEK
ncbi:MAG: hypothetical protein ABSC08_19035 [Bryobacteraceae bacterium]|jgi:hypothetical protein